MVKLKIVQETLTKTAENIEGFFVLSNGMKVNFLFDEKYNSWQQWGVSKEYLWTTVERLEELKNQFVIPNIF